MIPEILLYNYDKINVPLDNLELSYLTLNGTTIIKKLNEHLFLFKIIKIQKVKRNYFENNSYIYNDVI
jgi:hypothetical protein